MGSESGSTPRVVSRMTSGMGRRRLARMMSLGTGASRGMTGRVSHLHELLHSAGIERPEAHKSGALPERYVMAGSGESFDHIIVGAGSSGCVLANRLSADPNRRVLVLEAGASDWNPLIRMPIGEVFTVGTSMDWQFRSGPEPHLDGNQVKQPRGKVIGGSSSINGQVYVRGHARDYDEWAQLGNTGWSYEDVLPFFKRAERWQGGRDAFRGSDGPLQNRARPLPQRVGTRPSSKRGSRWAIRSTPTTTARNRKASLGASTPTPIDSRCAARPPTLICIRCGAGRT